MIRITAVSKSFWLGKQKLPVLQGIDLLLQDGVFTVLLGPSGCGKSTLLQLIAGFYPPDCGTIEQDGKVSFMAQDDMLLPWRTVADNVCFPLELGKGKRRDLPQPLPKLLSIFGLSGFGDSYPSQLSGGMRQRAALLRTYIDGGDYWLLDEPFGKLDALTREELQEWLYGLSRQLGRGILFVTHDIDEALRLADRVLLMSAAPGRLILDQPGYDAPIEEKPLSWLAENKRKIRRLLQESKQPVPEEVKQEACE